MPGRKIFHVCVVCQSVLNKEKPDSARLLALAEHKPIIFMPSDADPSPAASNFSCCLQVIPPQTLPASLKYDRGVYPLLHFAMQLPCLSVFYYSSPPSSYFFPPLGVSLFSDATASAFPSLSQANR